MRSPEQTAEMVRQQVNAKVLWGADDDEVLDWLRERHGIPAESAGHLLDEAHRQKRGAVRRKAFIYLFFSIPGMLLAAGYVFLQSAGRFIVIGYGTLAIYMLGLASVIAFFRSIYQLLTGRVDGSVN